MLKHGPVHKMYGTGSAHSHSHLDPIKDFVTKGVADSRQRIVLQPMACDVKGAKKHSGQQCVIARALNRTLKPQAVAVGRSMAFVVVNGLAVRFSLPKASTKVVDEWDEYGRVKKAPIELHPVAPSQKLRAKKAAPSREVTGAKRKRMKKIGVRAVGGGIAL